MGVIKKEKIFEMLSFGAEAVIQNEGLINEINVFPVPDADTGSNLTATFSGIKQYLRKGDLEQVLNAALMFSQGNSGIMMTAYLSGFLTHLKDEEEIDNEKLAKAFLKGSESAKNSVADPKKGTMLDVMEEFAESFDKTRSFDESLKHVKEALVATEDKMEVLSKNHVVDAGALGFTILIFAFCGQTFDFSDIDLHKVDSKKIEFGKNPFEVVFIANNCTFKIQELRDMFHPLGDSLDIVEVEDKIKVHIHTNEPDLVNQTANLIGNIESIKTVDMRIDGGHI